MNTGDAPLLRGHRIMRLHGLPPIAEKGARVLILGSFPSEASLRAQRYYAHPRNQFWAVVEALFGIARDEEYARRCRQLAARGVAVWDVIGSCRRRGSLDSAIRDAEVNDFAAFYRRHRRIEAVFFNGAEAERRYRRLVDTAVVGEAPAGVRLPSTSPANAAMSLAGKIEMWRAVQTAVDAAR
ncbi:MAG: DNA-deoxyinosine glycosylase [Gammaproteobacteria bacterium]|nr:DNA-deoxyinosine glycosylase [Gammaproteobacteria bacterium]